MSEGFERASAGHARFPWPQLVSLVVGLALILYGMVGFWPTAFSTLVPGDGGGTLLGVQVSPLRNIIHLGLGLVGLMCATQLPAARAFGWLLGLAGAVMAVFGIIGLVDPGADVLSMNLPAVVIAVLLALVGVVTALAPARSAVGSGGDPHDGRNPTEHAGGRRDVS